MVQLNYGMRLSFIYLIAASVIVVAFACGRFTGSVRSSTSAQISLPLVVTLSSSLVRGGASSSVTVSGGLGPYVLSIVSGGGSISGTSYTSPVTPAGVKAIRVTDSLGAIKDIRLVSFGDPLLWFRGDSLVGTYADGSTVSQWNDESTNGNHATSGAGPTLVGSGAGMPNGKPFARFSAGSAQYLITGSAVGALNDVTVFGVFRSDGSIRTNEEFFGGAWNVNVTLSRGSGSADTWGTWINGNQGYHGTFPDGQWALMTSRRSGATHYLYKEGTELGNANVGGVAMTSQAMTIGRNPDIVMYSRDLAQAERESIECYLGSKYAFSIGHSCP
jgi:hypothetical protein